MQPDDDNHLHSASGSVTNIEPIAAPIDDACRISGLSRSGIYRCLASGEIQAVKSGSRTLVLIGSLRKHIASLPAATFGTTEPQAAA